MMAKTKLKPHTGTEASHALLFDPKARGGTSGSAVLADCLIEPNEAREGGAPLIRPNGNHSAVVKEASEAHHSSDAFRSLLDHLDSEIAALRYRQRSIASPRQAVEPNPKQRIRELFRFIDRPWLLLANEGVEHGTPLPSTAYEVYEKEKRGQTGAKGGGGKKGERETVLTAACHRNWKGLSGAERAPYEMAARLNAGLRKELRRKMAEGCARFEGFCEKMEEWTAKRVRDEKMGGMGKGKSGRKSVVAKRRGVVKPAVRNSHRGEEEERLTFAGAPSPAGAKQGSGRGGGGSRGKKNKKVERKKERGDTGFKKKGAVLSRKSDERKKAPVIQKKKGYMLKPEPARPKRVARRK